MNLFALGLIIFSVTAPIIVLFILLSYITRGGEWLQRMIWRRYYYPITRKDWKHELEKLSKK